MNDIKDIIKENLLTPKGSVKPNITKKYTTEINHIKNVTSFLTDDVVLGQRIWHILNDVYYIKLCTGNNILTFNSLNRGYSTYCNNQRCICKKDIIEKVKATNLERFGVEFASQSKLCKEKVKATNLERYGVEHPYQSKFFVEKAKKTTLERHGHYHALQNENIKEKAKKTNLERYGVDNASKSILIKEKIKNNNLKKYGVTHPNKLQHIKEKAKKTNLERYGFECAFQSNIVKTKIKNTNLERYGFQYATQSNIVKVKTRNTNLERYGTPCSAQSILIKEKIKNTNLERYGVENALQNEDIKEKAKKTNLERYGVSVGTQRHLIDLMPLINSNDFWNKFNTPSEIFTFFKDRVSVSHIYKYIKKYRPDLICVDKVSYPHKIINEFLDNLGIEYQINTRKVISPVELDIFIPSKNLAIEINGVYWHTEEKGKNKHYHLNKLNKCIEKKIDLIHLTDIDILNKRDIIFNLIREKLNLNTKINIKFCSVIDLDNETVIQFIKENSLFEYKESNIHKGLIYQNELISIICVKELNNQFEITNYTTKIGYNIKNKLDILKSFNSTFFVNVDRNMFNKNIFEDSNWELKEISLPDFKYSKEYGKLYNKDMLENNLMCEYNKFWDCGTKQYTYST